MLFVMKTQTDLGITTNWAANSTQAPDGARLADATQAISQGGHQWSSSADWLNPSTGSFTVGEGSTNASGTMAVTFK